MAEPTSETDMLQVLIDVPELQQYYHADVRPERIPLRLVCADPVCKDAAPTKFGEPVVISDRISDPALPHLEITGVERSQDRSVIAFRYAVEGVAGRVELHRGATGWSVGTATIVEQ